MIEMTKHAHLFRLDLPLLVWRCACGEAMTDEAMPREGEHNRAACAAGHCPGMLTTTVSPCSCKCHRPRLS